VVRREPDTASLVVAGRTQPEKPYELRALVDGQHEDPVKLPDVHGNEIRTAAVVLSSESMVGTARIERNAVTADAARLDLDPQYPTIGRGHGAEIKRKTATERHQNVNFSQDQVVQHRCIGGVSSVDRVHVVHRRDRTGRTHVRPAEPLAFALPRP
jgi:hypothetical protein